MGRRVLARSLNLELSAGEWCAVWGANGSGKTSFLKILAGLRTHAPRVVTQGRVCYLAAEPQLLMDFTVWDNLLFFVGCFGLRSIPNSADAVLERLGLLRHKHQTARSLSTGQRRRLVLAGVVLARPTIVLADEPTNGLDPDGRALAKEILQQDLLGYGGVLVVATHDQAWCAGATRSLNFGDGVSSPAGHTPSVRVPF